MPFRATAELHPLPKIKESFEKTAEFVFSLGVHPGNVRLKAYRDFLDAVSKDETVHYAPPQAIRLWREIHELTWVISVFKDNQLQLPKELLIRSFDGNPLDNYESEPGRNVFLELRAAIYFLRVGYEVVLGEDCDVIAIRGKTRIFVECKRLYSEARAKKRAADCYKQLGIRLAKADRRYKNLGLAWIDPSAAMQKHYFVYTAYSEAGVRHAARMDLVWFWKQWLAGFQRRTDKRIFALVLQMVSPSWVAESTSIRTGFTSYVLTGSGKTSFGGLWRCRRLLGEILDIEDH